LLHAGADCLSQHKADQEDTVSSCRFHRGLLPLGGWSKTHPTDGKMDRFQLLSGTVQAKNFQDFYPLARIAHEGHIELIVFDIFQPSKLGFKTPLTSSSAFCWTINLVFSGILGAGGLGGLYTHIFCFLAIKTY
jgi:hypothetical protein